MEKSFNVYDTLGGHRIVIRQKTYEMLWMLIILVSLPLFALNIGFAIVLLLLGAFMLYREFMFPKRKALRYFNKAATHYLHTKYDNAANMIDKAVELDENNPLYNRVAVMTKYCNLNDFDGAVDNLRRLIDHYPNAEYKMILADCLFQTKYYSKAIQILEYIKFEDDRETTRQILLAKCYVHKESISLGIEILRNVVGSKRKMTGDLLDAKYWLGFAHLKNDDKKNAKKQLSVVFAHDANYLEVRNLIGELG